MNDLLLQFQGAGLAAKMLGKALVLPPMPLFLLVLLGAVLAWRGWRVGWKLQAMAWVGLWLICTPAAGLWLTEVLTRPPAALSAADRRALVDAPATAVLVLGAGRLPHNPDYDAPDLRPLGLQRLRYGLWLARQTRLPLGFSGGVSPVAEPGPSEAAVAALVLQREHGPALRWREERSTDTRSNARESVALLRRDGIRRIVLVTHAVHQQRALAAFRRAIAEQAAAIELVPAPMGLESPATQRWRDWLPSPRGLLLCWMAVYEGLGWRLGA